MSDKLSSGGRAQSLEARSRGKKASCNVQEDNLNFEGGNENGLGQRFSMGPTLPRGVFWKFVEILLLSKWLGGPSGKK